MCILDILIGALHKLRSLDRGGGGEEVHPRRFTKYVDTHLVKKTAIEGGVKSHQF